MHSDERTGAGRLGLGCSRLGSINGVARSDAEHLLEAAVGEGYRFFDTSNIYGQGDSERLIGKVVGNRSDCVVCTKGGKHLPLGKRLLVPVKGFIRAVARRSNATRSRVGLLRNQPLPMRWDDGFLSAAIDGSLRRLQRDAIDIYLLHSPQEQVIRAGEAMHSLHRAQQAGKIRTIGVSVDDVGTALAALEDPRVRALQIPLHPDSHEYDHVLVHAVKRGVMVIAREVLGGPSLISSASDPAAYASSRVRDAINDPRITTVLVGTTKISNMKAAARAAGLAPGTSTR